MANTWIIDLGHYLTPDGEIVDFAGRARAEYFASIVVYATASADAIVGVRCRRRPRHQRCAGIIVSALFADDNEYIHWYCPVCDDNGKISGWKNTRWDETLRSAKEPAREEWLDLGEDERLRLVQSYHRRARVQLPNIGAHASFHVIVENQAALGDEIPVQRRRWLSICLTLLATRLRKMTQTPGILRR